jgi:hypothetical protein
MRILVMPFTVKSKISGALLFRIAVPKVRIGVDPVRLRLPELIVCDAVNVFAPKIAAVPVTLLGVIEPASIASVTAPLSIVHTVPELLTVIDPLSPSLTPTVAGA